MEQDNNIKGGEFLIKETQAKDIFTPEKFTEEDLMFAQSTKDFLDTKVIPRLEEMDEKKEGILDELMKEASELGLLAFSAPEEFEGLGQNFSSSMLITQIIGGGHSFAVTFAAHTGIGMMPIILYGSKEQQSKYLPDMVSGRKNGAYCLTEPGAGSDANSIKTKAVLSGDGKYYQMTGQKMWITNGGFADIFIVFARVDDDKGISAFIVEKEFEGVKTGAEEHKMGIKGSSTTQLFFEDCKVPVENLLGKREDGFKIAMNILNHGRLKLAGACVGAAKRSINHAIEYSQQRKQFGKLISEFGAIQHKIAEQCIKTFAIESALYRCTGNIDQHMHSLIDKGNDYQSASLSAYKEFAVEAAILKVFGSEMLDYVVDESVQIYGGMGYSTETPVERAYRDSRINRIFEGTNEINRLLVVDMLLKRAFKGELDLLSHAKKVAKDLIALPDFKDAPEGILEKELEYIRNFKKAALLVAGGAAQNLMQKLADEQELLMDISDIIAEIYIAESFVLRALNLQETDNTEKKDILADMAKVYVYDAADRISKCARDASTAFSDGDELKMILLGIKRYTKTEPLNTKELRRKTVKYVLENGSYPFF